MTETGVPCPECTNRRLRGGPVSSNTPSVALHCQSCGVYYAASESEINRGHIDTRLVSPASLLDSLTVPISGIENRTPQEVFDIMCARIRAAGGIAR